MNPLLSTCKFRMRVERDSTLAKRLGVEPTALANYKKGDRRMPDTAIARMAEVMDIPLGDAVALANIGLERTDKEEEDFWIARIESEEWKSFATQYRKYKPAQEKP